MAETIVKTPTIAIGGGVELPMIGFGTYQMPSRITQGCVEEALEVGYRAVDTAQCYGNEEQVGRAIAAWGAGRESVFVTTKTWTDGYRSTRAGIERSSRLLGGYVDLLLIHEPTSDVEGTWRALEDAQAAGLARAIGVSNFFGGNLDGLLETAHAMPAVDQVETHVFRQQAALREKLARNGIVMQAWSPLACGRSGIFRSPVLCAIAAAHGKTAAQVALRWLVQRGIPLNAKSTHAARMGENLDVFDFGLSEEEMESIAPLDTGRSQFGWW